MEDSINYILKEHCSSEDEAKLKSYALLMAYDLPNFILGIFDDLKATSSEEYESFIRYLNIDIYSWDPTKADLSFLYSILKLISKVPRVEVSHMFVYFTALHFSSPIYSLDILAKRYSFIVSKYYYQADFLFKIFDNYLELKKHHKDIEIGSDDFNEIIVKRINKGGKHLTSNHIYKDVNQYFFDSNEKKTPKHNFILKNLPLDILNEISTSNRNKVKNMFKKQLANDLFPYIDSTTVKRSVKERAIGMSFAMARLSFSEKEYIQNKILKDQFYEFDMSDYHAYLRTEGKNVIQSM